MAEGIVYQDDKTSRIYHDHALRKRIECGFHASGNNAGGVQLTEGAFHEEEIAHESRDTDKRQEAHPRIREEPLKAGYVRMAKRNLQHTPPLVAGKDRDLEELDGRFFTGRLDPYLRMVTNLCDDRPAFL